MEHSRTQFLPATRLRRISRRQALPPGRYWNHILHLCGSTRAGDGLHYQEIQRLRFRAYDDANAHCHDTKATLVTRKDVAEQHHVLDLDDHRLKLSKSLCHDIRRMQDD